MERCILHCDLNAFFASVEEAKNPELKKVPMAVCGDPESRHGIILAKNQLAAKFGIKTAETIYQAQRKCPNLKLVRSHHKEYSEYSKIVNKIYERFTDLVEPFGIDESWLDVTGSLHLFGTPRELADKIRETVKEETSLTVSVGVSFNKVFAKLGSDYKKPDATTVISKENYKEIVWPLPVSDLLFVGRTARGVLSRLGIMTIGDLARSNRDAVISLLGKTGGVIHDYANGIDDSPVSSFYEESTPKSIGRGRTFHHDLTKMSDIAVGISLLADEVATRLRRHGLKCRVVSLAVRDPSFKTVSRQSTLKSPTFLERDISAICLELFSEANKKALPVRMLTVTASSLIPADEADIQLSLFENDDKGKQRHEQVELAIDKIRDKYGKGSISKANLLSSDIELPEK